MNKTQTFTQQYTKQNVPPLRAGDTVRVHERVKEKEGEKQPYKEKQPTAIARVYDAIKNKYCPQIDWSSIKK